MEIRQKARMKSEQIQQKHMTEIFLRFRNVISLISTISCGGGEIKVISGMSNNFSSSMSHDLSTYHHVYPQHMMMVKSINVRGKMHGKNDSRFHYAMS